MSSITAPPTVPSPEPHRRPGRGGATTGISASASAQKAKPKRDPVIDAVRAVCLFVVVTLHALLVGAWRTGDGGLATRVALTDLPWFPALTWLVQVMPLFFIAGGFAAISQWRAMRAGGASAADYVTGRIRRLAVPAAVMITVVGAGLALARLLSHDAESSRLLAEAAYRIGQPLWFLAVYAGVTALVPIMAALHERFRWTVPTVLLLAALGVDLVRRATGFDGVGYANLVFVWLFAQQLGFGLADAAPASTLAGGKAAGAKPSGFRPVGGAPTPPRPRPVAGLLCAIAGAAYLGAHGWSLNLLDALNPPTAVLALLGVAQLCALRLAYPRLRALVARPAVARIVGRAGSCAITVYLWHMPIIMTLVAGLWAVGAPLPPVHSLAWWATRGMWLLGIAVCVIPVGLALSPIERWKPRVPAGWTPRPWSRWAYTLAGSRPARILSTRRAASASAVVLTVLGTGTALIGGLGGPVTATAAALCLWAAIALSCRPRAAALTAAHG